MKVKGVIIMEIGELIAMYRKKAGMTIDELAEKSNVPKGTLNKIIGGITKAPTLDTVKAIAKALGKNLSDFDDIEKTPPSNLKTVEDGEAEDLLKTMIYDICVKYGWTDGNTPLSEKQFKTLQAIMILFDLGRNE